MAVLFSIKKGIVPSITCRNRPSICDNTRSSFNPNKNLVAQQNTDAHLQWDDSGFDGNLAEGDDTLQKVFDKVDDLTSGAGISETNINTLSKLNNIVNDATLIDGDDLATIATTGSYTDLTDKPTLGTAASEDVEYFATAAQGTLADSAIQSGDLATVATTGSYTDLTDKPTLGTAAAEDVEYFATTAQGALADSAIQSGDLATIATTGSYTDLTDKPTLGTAAAEDVEYFATAAQGTLADSAIQSGDLATIATTGSYTDLTDKPTLGTAAAEDVEYFATTAQGALADSAIQSDDLATVATTGSYTDLTDKPTLGLQPSDITSGTITPGTGNIDFDNLLSQPSIPATEYGDLLYGSETGELVTLSGNKNNELKVLTQTGIEPELVSYASSSTAVVSSYQSSITINKPSGTVENDLLICIIGNYPTRTVDTLVGWTSLGTQTQGVVGGIGGTAFYKIAGASEPASYTFSWVGGTAWGSAIMLRTTGADVVNPIDVSTYNGVNTSGLTFTSPSVTTTVTDTLLYRLAVSNDDGEGGTISTTPPSEHTYITQGARNDKGHTIAFRKNVPNAGAVGTATIATESINGGSVDFAVNFVIAVKASTVAVSAPPEWEDMSLIVSPVGMSGSYTDLTDKPTLGTAAAEDVEYFATAAQGALADSAIQSDDLATVATTGSYIDLTDKPTLVEEVSDLKETIAVTMGDGEPVPPTTIFNTTWETDNGGWAVSYSSRTTAVPRTGSYSLDIPLTEYNNRITLLSRTFTLSNSGVLTFYRRRTNHYTWFDLQILRNGSLLTRLTGPSFSDTFGAADTWILTTINIPAGETTLTVDLYGDIDNHSSSNRIYLDDFTLIQNGGTPTVFKFNGSSKENLLLLPGVDYKFDQSDASNVSLLKFSDEPNNIDGTEHTTGITATGTTGTDGVVSFNIPYNAPARLYPFATGSSVAGNDSSFVIGYASDDLATVATTGSYIDLTDKPTLGTAAAEDVEYFATTAQGALADSAIQSDDLATVATTGSYTDLTDKPTLDSNYIPLEVTAGTATALTNTKYRVNIWPSSVVVTLPVNATDGDFIEFIIFDTTASHTLTFASGVAESVTLDTIGDRVTLVYDDGNSYWIVVKFQFDGLQPSDITSGTITPGTGNIDFDNLLSQPSIPATEYGDLLYGSETGELVILSGNKDNELKVLTQTGVEPAAVAYASSSTAVVSSYASSITINKPSGTVENDLLICIIGNYPTLAVDTLVGWTSLGTRTQGGTIRGTAFYKIAGASEPASYTFSWVGGNAWGSAIMLRTTGADMVNPIDVSTYNGVNTSGLTFTSPSVTTTVTDTLLYRLAVSNHDGEGGTISTTPPSGHTYITQGALNKDGHTIAFRKNVPNAGAVGTATIATESIDGGNVDFAVNFVIAVKASTVAVSAPPEWEDMSLIVSPVGMSGSYTDLTDKPTLGTAAAEDVEYFATAAQGALADSAIQSGDNVSALNNDAGYLTDVPTDLMFGFSGEDVDLTTGTAKLTFRMPYAMTLNEVRTNVTTAPIGSAIIVDVNQGGSSILSTKLSIDAGENTSTTAATPAVISTTDLTDDAEITVDIDQVGSSTPGTGIKLILKGTRN